jgi:hypothetical protein
MMMMMMIFRYWKKQWKKNRSTTLPLLPHDGPFGYRLVVTDRQKRNKGVSLTEKMRGDTLFSLSLSLSQESRDLLLSGKSKSRRQTEMSSRAQFVGAIVVNILLLLSAILLEGCHAFHYYLTLSSSSAPTSGCCCCATTNGGGGASIDFASSSIQKRRNRRRRRKVSHSSHRLHCTTTLPTTTTTTLMMTLDEIPNISKITIANNKNNNNKKTADSNNKKKDMVLYNIPNSGWKSPQWNWGSARGTGHDCASICRSRWSKREDRRKLVHSLLQLSPVSSSSSSISAAKSNTNNKIEEEEEEEEEVSFEEIKLILALAWQRGRWDGTDGGPTGYRSVLQTMADAHRYENEDEILSSLHFIEDVSSKYHTISRNAEELHKMKDINNSIVHGGKKKHARIDEIFMARRVCAGMVLDAMHFVDNGL